MPTSLLPPGALCSLSFSFFYRVEKAIGDSRVYAGIHFAPSCAKGIQLGEKVAQNVHTFEVFERVNL